MTELMTETTLIRRYHQDGDLAAREALIEQLTPLVRHIALRYANRGEPLDDLIQVGTIGLIKAVDRFELDRGAKLSTFAAPNIAGEIKRHFRDRGWAIRPPRDVQELGAKLTRTVDALTVKLQRSPNVTELAEALEVSEEQILDAMVGQQTYSTVSFEEPIGENRTALDVLGAEDADFDVAEARALLDSCLPSLDPRSQRIVQLRFHEELTQREIADQLGISQMHVSRLLRRALDDLREQLDAPGVAEQTLQTRRHLRVA